MNIRTLIGTAIVAAFTFTSPAQAQSPAENPTTPPPKPERQAPKVERRLKTFDALDFDVFSNQKWDRLHESHSKDIVVTWPDGHEKRGIDEHIEDLKAMFVFAPDITIKMLIAILAVHAGKGFFVDKGGYEYALALFAASVSLLFSGGGRLSADTALAARTAGG